ncbi:MAG TPA: SpoIIE family protein phosphatase [Marinobacter sp.]|nr:SpoIIE family protein phosphatase [Marinobacter sp.]
MPAGVDSQAPEQALHILVVDDDPTTRVLLASFLRQEGHTVAMAENGQEALLLFERDRAFDLFIIDVTMPVMDGLTLSQALKARLERWVPIILISANAEERSQVLGLDVGADYYLTKPVSFPLLRANVRASQRIASLQRELETTNDSLVNYFNRINADNDLARELLDRILYQSEENDTSARYIISPAGDFSGDMIISTRSPAQRYYSMIADATGHGLPAAITLMPAVETFTRLARDGYSLETIVRELNTRLRESLPRGRFVAATLIMVEPHTHRLEIWNGGSPAAYLIDNTERTIIKQFPARHPPLGVLADDDFDVRIQSHAHRAEYTLVACTDGVVEAESADGAMFGSRGLEALLVSKERDDDILLELDRTLDRFTGGGDGRDDRTLLVLPLENIMPVIHPLRPEMDEPGLDGVPEGGHEERSSGGWYFAIGVRGDVLSEAELAPTVNGMLSHVGLMGEDADRAHVCVTELINNAIDHGVLGLDSSLKQSPDGFDQYFKERRSRLRRLKEGGVFVRAHLDRMGDYQSLRVAVSDSGSGFGVGPDGEALMPRAGDLPAHAPHGRGIRLVQRLADRLVFHDGGSTAEFHITVTAHSARN